MAVLASVALLVPWFCFLFNYFNSFAEALQVAI